MNVYHSKNKMNAQAMVATSVPAAAQAGAKMLEKGGNAVDAAIASAIALTVVEPTSNGIGGDAFAIIYDGTKLHGFNASGRSPKKINDRILINQGLTQIPEDGWFGVTVPGAPSAWQDIHSRFGKLPIEVLFEPAIELAQSGFAVTKVVAENWHKSIQRFSGITDPSCHEWMNCFSNNGSAPNMNDHWTSPDQAKTLMQLQNKGITDFYNGELAKKIVEFSHATNGFLELEDLSEHKNNWVNPISINYRGIDVVELPPNGQGLAALIGLSLLSNFNPGSRRTAEFIHQQIESMKLAMADALHYISDPQYCGDIVTKLLNAQYLQDRSTCINHMAGDPKFGIPNDQGTVYLCAADKQGMMVSYIQSNYNGFGSGVVIPDTGIAMQNRGCNFNLSPGHVNRLTGGKRSYHTIIPGFLMRGDEPLGPFGIMGAFMQPQAHLQVVSSLVDHHLSPQQALDLPRWRIVANKNIEVEKTLSNEIINALIDREHQITIPNEISGFGRGQIILRNDDGYIGASDQRADGCVVTL